MSEPQTQTQIQTPGASEAPEPMPHIRGIKGENLMEQISRVLEELKRGGLLVVKIKKNELLKALPGMNSRPWYQWVALRRRIEATKSREFYVWIGYSDGRYPLDTVGWPYYYIAISTQYTGGRLHDIAIILINPNDVQWLAAEQSYAVSRLIDLIYRLVNVKGDGIGLNFLVEELIRSAVYARYIKSRNKLPPITL